MSVQLAPEHVLKRIALEYNPEGRFANKPCPPASKVAIIAANDPSSLLRKKLRSVVSNDGVGALKMLRLHGEVTARGAATGPLWDAFIELIKTEADRLVERAVELSTRHGHKARVRLSTLKALHKAGFVKTEDLKLIEHNMLTEVQIRHLIEEYNGEDSIRWEFLKKAYSGIVPSEALPPQTRPAPKKLKPTINNRERRANGTMPRKPITRMAFLESADGAKKQEVKDERTIKAQARRRGFKANGGSKVGGPGEGVTVRNADLDLCTAGHASSGDKVAK